MVLLAHDLLLNSVSTGTNSYLESKGKQCRLMAIFPVVKKIHSQEAITAKLSQKGVN